MRVLGDASVEVWRSSSPVTQLVRDGVTFAHDGQWLFGSLAVDDGEIAAAARDAYERIVRVTREEGFPRFLRFWNHVRDLNAGDGDAERYKHFSAGRHEALTAAGFAKNEFPAACAVGMRGGNLAIHFVASRTPGRNVENPRQVSAYDYPRRYGVRSPSFARATVAEDGSVFISGTASVVGHETVHIGDVAAQCDETLANLARIAAECGASLGDAQLVKIYVRHAADAPRIAPAFQQAIPGAALLMLESDICRADLLLEAEATILSGTSGVSVDVILDACAASSPNS